MAKIRKNEGGARVEIGVFCEMSDEMGHEEGLDKVARKLEEYGIRACSIGFYPNNIDPDPERRKHHNELLVWVLEAAAELGVPVVSAHVGYIRGEKLEKQVEEFKKVFTPIAEKAEKLGVKIAFENCPGWTVATTPEIWEMLFEAVPSPALGLEFDPSHLYWQGVDVIEAVYEFGNRIYHVHAKDTEIIEGKLAKCGIYGEGWWRYRIPGWGDIDWEGFVRALVDVGYDYVLSIEHEDPVFHGERFKKGLELGHKYLAQFV